MKFILAVIAILVCTSLAEAAPRGWVCGPNGCRPALRAHVPAPTPSVAQGAKGGERRVIVGVLPRRDYGVRGAFTRVAASRPLRRILTLPFRAFRAVRGR